LGDRGARINASTSKNRTEFHCVVPTEVLMEALSLEALRMEKSPIEGLKTERIVVR
jgi:predicted Zn-dependent peptidase